jgi:hypothetical protein
MLYEDESVVCRHCQPCFAMCRSSICSLEPHARGTHPLRFNM